jgi:hypothetical protein
MERIDLTDGRFVKDFLLKHNRPSCQRLAASRLCSNGILTATADPSAREMDCTNTLTPIYISAIIE